MGSPISEVQQYARNHRLFALAAGAGVVAAGAAVYSVTRPRAIAPAPASSGGGTPLGIDPAAMAGFYSGGVGVGVAAATGGFNTGAALGAQGLDVAGSTFATSSDAMAAAYRAASDQSAAAYLAAGGQAAAGYMAGAQLGSSALVSLGQAQGALGSAVTGLAASQGAIGAAGLGLAQTLGAGVLGLLTAQAVPGGGAAAYAPPGAAAAGGACLTAAQRASLVKAIATIRTTYIPRLSVPGATAAQRSELAMYKARLTDYTARLNLPAC